MLPKPVLHNKFSKGDLVEAKFSDTRKYHGIVVKEDRNHTNYYRVWVFGHHRHLFVGADQLTKIA